MKQIDLMQHMGFRLGVAESKGIDIEYDKFILAKLQKYVNTPSLYLTKPGAVRIRPELFGITLGRYLKTVTDELEELNGLENGTLFNDFFEHLNTNIYELSDLVCDIRNAELNAMQEELPKTDAASEPAPDDFAEDGKEACNNDGLQEPGYPMQYAKKSLQCCGADYFELLWRANSAAQSLVNTDSSKLCSLTDKYIVDLPHDITISRLLEALDTTALALTDNLEIDEDIIDNCREYDPVSGGFVPLDTVYIGGVGIFEYAIKELFKEESEGIDFREMFEDCDISIPFGMTNERLRDIYNSLTIGGDADFADTLDVSDFTRVILVNFGTDFRNIFGEKNPSVTLGQLQDAIFGYAFVN